MKYNYQSRLKVYHKTLGEFDLIDKYNICKSTFFKSMFIKISWDFNKTNKIDLKKLLFKEFFLQQRFNYKKTFKRIENSFFTVTLRKKKVFFYLEMLLNSYFLNNNKLHISNILNSTILTKLMIPVQNKFFINSTYSSQFNILIIKNFIKLNSLLNIKQSLVYLNYNFLPIHKI